MPKHLGLASTLITALPVFAFASSKNAVTSALDISFVFGTLEDLLYDTAETASENQAPLFFFWAGIAFAATGAGFLGKSLGRAPWERRKAVALFSIKSGEDV